MLGKAKDLYKLKKQADQMKRIMAGITVNVDHRGVKLTMQGDQKVVSIKIDGEERDDVKEAINKAVKESQKKAAKKMQGFAGDLGLPGF
jgi:DNA-binding protein YbaB